MTLDLRDTPVLCVDLDIMEANIQRTQAYCDAHGLKLRPHIKTHKIPEIAHMQLRAGASGIACQKLGEVEVMVDAGITDIMIPYNIVGRPKLERLAALAQRANLTVAVDSLDSAKPLDEFLASAGVSSGCVIELEHPTAKRCGVGTVQAAVSLARQIADGRGGLRLRGVMHYPTDEESKPLLRETVSALKAEGLSTEIVSGGGSATFSRAHTFGGLTEYRVGTNIFNDWTCVRGGYAALEQCALSVIVTVVSTPAADRAIVDGGSKTFTSDAGLPMGHIVEYPDASIVKMNEEHGFVDVSRCARKPKVGEPLHVIPNHACGCVNMHNRLVGMRKGKVEVVWTVAARGLLQ